MLRGVLREVNATSGVRIRCAHCVSFNVCIGCEPRLAVGSVAHQADHDVFQVLYCADDIKAAEAAERNDEKFMAEHANLLGTGLGGVGAAQMAMVAAIAALNSLCKADITELKALNNPPHAVARVLDIVSLLVDPTLKTPDWKTSRKMMQKSDFLNRLMNLDLDAVKWSTVRARPGRLSALSVP